MSTTERKPSPRWAFWERFDIPCQDGLIYLSRLRIIQTPWFGVYLHDIAEPDHDPHGHTHPWSFISIILRGHYTERFWPDPGDPSAPNWHQKWGRFSIHRMDRTAAHRIVQASPGLRSLILVGRRASSWGFWVDGELIDWTDYLRSDGMTRP